MARYELMLAGKRETVIWSGETGEDAARRYVDCNRDAAVIAWRNAPGPVLSVLTRGAVIDGQRVQ